MPAAFVCVCVFAASGAIRHKPSCSVLMAISFGSLVRSHPKMKMKSQRRRIVKCQRKTVIYVHV